MPGNDYLGRYVGWHVEYTDEVPKHFLTLRQVWRLEDQPRKINIERLIKQVGAFEAVKLLAQEMDRLCRDVESKSRSDAQLKMREALGIR